MDRLTEMEAFAAVIDQGGFTDAAKKMGISKSAVSKHVSSLEARLGARLLNRTTRRVSATEIGLAYYDRARRVINDAVDADALVSAMQSAPSGLLRICVAPDFGSEILSRILTEFLHDYPNINVNLALNTDCAEVLGEGFDLALHIGELEDSSFKARKLGRSPRRLIASPRYCQSFGKPQTLEDLSQHKLMHYASQSPLGSWRLSLPSGEKRQIRSAAWMTVNDGQSLLSAAMAGLGIAYLPRLLYGHALQEGLVEELLEDLPIEMAGIYALYPSGRFTQPKVRAFVDFLAHFFDSQYPEEG